MPAGAASSTISSLDSGFVSHDASSLHTAYHDPGLLQLNNAKVSYFKTFLNVALRAGHPVCMIFDHPRSGVVYNFGRVCLCLVKT